MRKLPQPPSIEELPRGSNSYSVTGNIAELMQRGSHINKFGFVRYTKECVEALAALLNGKKVIEVGSGTGYLAALLKERGVDIFTVDIKDPTFHSGNRVKFHIWLLDAQGDALEYLPDGWDVVLMCWPNYASPFAFKVAKKMRSGQTLIYQGEGCGGCTADDKFYDYVFNEEKWDDLGGAGLNEGHVTFFGIHDHWMVFKKK